MELAATESLAGTHDRHPKVDHWTALPAFAALAIAQVVALLCSLPGSLSFFLILLTALGAPWVAAGLVVIAAVIALLRRRPRLAVSILIAVLLPPLLWKPITWTAEVIHLGITVGTGAGQLGHSSTPGGSPFAAYDWSVGLAGGPNTFLIHDVTDEIALPPELHKQPLASELGFGEECAGNVTHLLGHYYVCTF